MGKRNRKRVARIRAGLEKPRNIPAEERRATKEAFRSEVKKIMPNSLPQAALLSLLLTSNQGKKK